MFNHDIVLYVKYNMFHAEDKRKYRNNLFLPQNMYYNEDKDYYVCPMEQRLEFIGVHKTVSDLGYESALSKYISQDCSGCPLRG